MCGLFMGTAHFIYGCAANGRISDVASNKPAQSLAKSSRINTDRYDRSDAQVNVFTDSSQDAVAAAVDSNGRTIAVWQSRRQENGTYGIFARIIDASGQPVGDERHINEYTENMQMRPSLAITETNDVWFVWESFGQDGDQGGVIARKFDSRLASLTSEIQVHSSGLGHQTQSSVAVLPGGGAVVVWSESHAGHTQRAMGRLLDSDGNFSGNDFRVGQLDGCDEQLPRVATDRAGRFAVVWARSNQNGFPTAILGRRFNSDASPMDNEFQVNWPDSSANMEPSLSMDESGAFMVTWLSSAGQVQSICWRRFDSDGQPERVVRSIPQPADWRITGLAGALGGRRGLALVWSTYRVDGGETDLMAQVFDGDGQPLGDPFRATASWEGTQQLESGSGWPQVVFGGDESLTVAWSGYSGADKSGAHVSRLMPNGRTGVPNDDESPRSPVIVAADAIDAHAAPHRPPVFDPNEVAVEPPDVASPDAVASPGGGFLGIASTGWNPPDPHLAVGLEHLVLIVNGKIAFFQKNGTPTFQTQIEGLFGFWGELGAGGFVFDPEVIFDPYSGRFMAMANERFETPAPGEPDRSYFLLAVSDDGDPNGSWHKYRIDVTGISGGDIWIDSPNIGVDEQVVYLSADMLATNQHLVLTVDKAPLLIGDPISFETLSIVGTHSPGLPIMHDAAPAFYMAHVETVGNFDSQSITLHAVTDPLGTPQRQTFNLAAPRFRSPAKVPQLGTPGQIETFDARFWSCTYRNGSLWAAHHIRPQASTGDNRTIVRWYEIAMNDWPVEPGATPELVQWGNVDPGGTGYAFFVAIAVDPQGNMGLVFSKSSSSQFVSINRTGRYVDDPPGTTHPMVTVQTSSSATNTSPHRWGDYAGLVVDPADDETFWLHHQYRTSNWRTWVDTFDLQSPQLVEAVPFDGYIDPRMESTDGSTLNLGLDRLQMTLTEPALGAGSSPLSAAHCNVSVTGGLKPGILSVDATNNPIIEITLDGIIPVQQYTTIECNVEDLAGNAGTVSVEYGFLPGDTNQDGVTSPVDLTRFRQLLLGLETPPIGSLDLYLDVNRDGFNSPVDLTRNRQLLLGASIATKRWLDESLP